ncbi:MAG: type II toxin-antitoxin system HicB family antitoxin [Methylomicrobium sp.]
MKYLAIIEPARIGFTCYSPDIPVCSVKGNNELEVQNELKRSIKEYFAQLKAIGAEIPKSTCKSVVIDLSE